MFYEWVLIFLLVLTALFVYLVLQFRKLLSKLESLETLTKQAPPVQLQVPIAGSARPGEAPRGGAEMDEELTAVITAAIAAYEADKR